MKKYSRIRNGKSDGTAILTDGQAKLLNSQSNNSGIKYVAIVQKTEAEIEAETAKADAKKEAAKIKRAENKARKDAKKDAEKETVYRK